MKIGTFKATYFVQYGTLVVTREDEIVWAGPANKFPMADVTATGLVLHVHPTYLTVLEERVAQLEKGIPDEHP